MKTLTCKDLGGPCETEISGDSFQEIGEKSHAHVVEEIAKGDAEHKAAVEAMTQTTPEEQKALLAEFERKFNEAPEVRVEG